MSGVSRLTAVEGRDGGTAETAFEKKILFEIKNLNFFSYDIYIYIYIYYMMDDVHTVDT